MPGPLGISAVSLTPIIVTDPPTFTELVNQTLPDADKQLADLDAKIAEMLAIEAALEADLPNMISDADAIDAALGDFSVIDWGSPEPDFGPVTDYLTAQRDGITGTINNAPAIAQVPVIGPDGQPVITVGAPPSQGGEPTAGGAPYVLHHPIPFSFDPSRLVGAAQLSGPNPPFVKLDGFHQDFPAKGLGGWVALIEINPARAGSFTASLQYKLAITLTGINTIVSYTVAVLVVITP
jgi:hypothetical protein